MLPVIKWQTVAHRDFVITEDANGTIAYHDERYKLVLNVAAKRLDLDELYDLEVAPWRLEVLPVECGHAPASGDHTA